MSEKRLSRHPSSLDKHIVLSVPPSWMERIKAIAKKEGHGSSHKVIKQIISEGLSK